MPKAGTYAWPDVEKSVQRLPSGQLEEQPQRIVPSHVDEASRIMDANTFNAR